MTKLKMLSLILALFASLFFLLSILFSTLNLTLFIDWSLFNSSSAGIHINLILDNKSLLFSSVVLVISSSILFYSMSYMLNEPFLWRFIFILLSFIISMIILIFSSNLISILLGWDGLGVSSYFLVIYYQNKASLNAGMITAMTNRLGDVGIIFLICLFIVYGTWNFPSISLNNFPFSWMFILLVITTISTKSAQIPFSAWLPAAMAAPTPVSSLVHSSTLVTAGIFLLIRLHNFNLLNNIALWIILVGLSSALMSSLAAILEKDFKKIIALSTLSHLGFMVVLIGLNNPDSAFFHLVMHAFFKALLFMTVGVIIHNSSGYQSFNMITSMLNISKINSTILTLSIFSLCGLPFLSGFYSKDLGLELSTIQNSNFLLLSLILIVSLASAIYSVRILKNVVLSSKKNLPINWIDKSQLYEKSMIALLLSSVLAGEFFQIKIFLGINFLFLSMTMKMIIPLSLLLLAIFSWMLFEMKIIKFSFWGNFLSSMFFLTPLSNFYPSLSSKTFSSLIINEQEKWISLQSTKIFTFWENLFFLEIIFSTKFYNFLISSILIFILCFIICFL